MGNSMAMPWILTQWKLTTKDKTSNDRSGKTKELQRINSMFHKYANNGIIDPDGIMTLCKDLDMKDTDIRVLMLAWKLKAARLGYFTMNEWQTGLKTLQVDTLSKLKISLSALEKEVTKQPSRLKITLPGSAKVALETAMTKDPAFVDFHSYAFRYHLTEDKQKSIDIETVCELLNLVLGSPFRCQVDLLIDYLKIQRDYKVITMDQWVNFLRFCNEISFPDLENYDETQAWPLILDNFVEWLRENH